jgi:hypothetical protein
MDTHCGEVICADTVHFEAECPKLYDAPNFGSFVRVDSAGLDIYGVVYHISTGCIDSHRKTQALNLPRPELATRMPHLELVLRTTFAARVVGFRVDGETYNRLPAQPAQIHCFVGRAGDEEVRALTTSTHFLRTLAATPDAPVEDLIAGALDAALHSRRGEADPMTQLIAWGKYLARLFRDDYDRLEAIMQRVRPLAGTQGMPWEEALPLTGWDRDPFV